MYYAILFSRTVFPNVRQTDLHSGIVVCEEMSGTFVSTRVNAKSKGWIIGFRVWCLEAFDKSGRCTTTTTTAFAS